MSPEQSLRGRRILVVEDDYLIATELVDLLVSGGAEVVGPVPSISHALATIKEVKNLHGAILDINLGGDAAYEVADRLVARRVPFLFATGYDRSAIPARFEDIVRCEKPVNLDNLISALFPLER